MVQDPVCDIPVTGSLCFVEVDWPLIGGSFATRGAQVLWPKRLTKLLTEMRGGEVDVAATRDALASRFKPS